MLFLALMSSTNFIEPSPASRPKEDLLNKPPDIPIVYYIHLLTAITLPSRREEYRRLVPEEKICRHPRRPPISCPGFQYRGLSSVPNWRQTCTFSRPERSNRENTKKFRR